MSRVTAAEQRPVLGTRRLGPTLSALGVVVLAVAVRRLMFRDESDDYHYFLHPWYEQIRTHGGFGALKDSGFADYNVPYLYILAGLTHLPVQDLAGIKAVSTLFDLLAAYLAHLIVALRHSESSWRPPLAGAVVLFLPTVATNSGWWGQADSVYTVFVLGGVYCVLRRRPWWACAFLGVALAFKLQAVFVLPFLLVLLLTRRVPWRALLAVPAAYLLLDVPALLIGADPGRLLTVYARQTGTYQELTMNAPSVYQFLRAGDQADVVRQAGVLVTGVVVLTLTALVVLRGGGRARTRPASWGRPASWARELTGTQVVLLATASAILVPFLLPSMHDRYFYLADVLSVVAAFHLPDRLWSLPVLVQVASFGSYLQYLAPGVGQYVKMEFFAALMGLALLVVLRVTAGELRREPAAPPDAVVPAPAGEPVPPARQRR